MDNSCEADSSSLMALTTVRQALVICPLCILAIVGIFWAKPAEGNTVFGLALLTGIIQAFAALFLVLFVRAEKSIRETLEERNVIEKIVLSDSDLFDEAFRIGRYAAIDTRPNPEHVLEWRENIKNVLSSIIGHFESIRVIRPEIRKDVYRAFHRGLSTLIASQSDGGNSFALSNNAIGKVIDDIYEEIKP